MAGGLCRPTEARSQPTVGLSLGRPYLHQAWRRSTEPRTATARPAHTGEAGQVVRGAMLLP